MFSFTDMSVIESPLNIAHRHRRRAQAYAVAHKYEEAIKEHATAAEILDKLMNTIDCEVSKESIKLQHDDHIRQLGIIKRKQKMAETKKAQETKLKCEAQNDTSEFGFTENKEDTYRTNKLIHQAVQAMCEQNSLISGLTDAFKQLSVSASPTESPLESYVVKLSRDEKAKFQELCVSNEALKKILFLLIADVEKIRSENKALRNSLEELLFYHQKCVSKIPKNLKPKDVPLKSSDTNADSCRLPILLSVDVPNII